MPPQPHEPNFLRGPGDYLTDPVHNDTYPAINPLKADLSGKSVFLSGASRGLGRAMSLSFAKAGASYITLGARGDMTSLVKEIDEVATAAGRKSPTVLPIKFDVTSQESVANAAAAVEREIGKVDIVVNNAGVLGAIKPITESDPDEWWNTWTINLRGTYLVTRAFLPLMLKGGDKQIVNVGSVGAHCLVPGGSAYQPSKLAQLRFTEFICTEYGDQGVMAFCIHPGNVVTDIVGGPEGVKGMGTEHIFVETPELSGDTIVYLVNEKREWLAGRYINGTWDMPQLMAMKDDIVKGDKLKLPVALPRWLTRVMPFKSSEPDVTIPTDLTIWDWLFDSSYSPLFRDVPIAGYTNAITGERIDYAQVKEYTTYLSTALVKEYGLKEGETVALFSPNTIWYPVAMLAVLRAGGVMSGASPAYNVEEMTYALKTANAKFLMTIPSSMDVAVAAARNAGIHKERIFLLEGDVGGHTTIKQLLDVGSSYGKERRQVPSFKIPKNKQNKDICGLLSFSSGTTGLPKAVFPSSSTRSEALQS
ncbi:MAG: hypothetical protein Q9180_005580 [Flavoplaca navasiana]